MRRFSSFLMVAAAGLSVAAAVMLVGDWMRPSEGLVEIGFELPAVVEAGIEVPLSMVVHNHNRSDIRIVGLNWC